MVNGMGTSIQELIGNVSIQEAFECFRSLGVLFLVPQIVCLTCTMAGVSGNSQAKNLNKIKLHSSKFYIHTGLIF